MLLINFNGTTLMASQLCVQNKSQLWAAVYSHILHSNALGGYSQVLACIAAQAGGKLYYTQ